jgi:alcohol dehydrogenase, propanol-preferring
MSRILNLPSSSSKGGKLAMKAMVLSNLCNLNEETKPLKLVDLPEPIPGDTEILVRIAACGVCHTELDEIEGRTPPSRFPMVLGHQIVGRVEQIGRKVTRYNVGDRVGIAWIYSSCGRCVFCLSGRENLCPDFKATGRDAYGGYAEFIKICQDFVFNIPDILSDAQAAPLLCAGAIGYRSLNLSNLEDGQALGLTGFGASAHIVLKLVKNKYPSTKIYVFARGPEERKFALELGADWAGGTENKTPEKLDCIIDTTPAWLPVVKGLENLKSGGRFIINAIRKEGYDKDRLFGLEYDRHLWMEKEIKSVANITRRDVAEFLEIASMIPIVPEVQEFALSDANLALMELKQRKIRGSKVMMISQA